jgi:transcriptional regulator with XRE-family HTH domain
MKQADLARASGISTSMISQIWNGQSAPGGPNLVKLASALGVAPSDLVPDSPLPGTSAVAGAQQVLRDRGARPFDPVHRPKPVPGQGEPSAYDRAALTFDRAARLAGFEPSEPVRVAMMQILFRHDIDAESVALLLEAVAPGDEVF